MKYLSKSQAVHSGREERNIRRHGGISRLSCKDDHENNDVDNDIIVVVADIMNDTTSDTNDDDSGNSSMNTSKKFFFHSPISLVHPTLSNTIYNVQVLIMQTL